MKMSKNTLPNDYYEKVVDMTEMITAQEAQQLAEKHSMTTTNSGIEKYIPEINELIKDFAENGFGEAYWDCSNALNLDEDAKDIIKIQLYLQTLGYDTKIVQDQNNFEDEDYDLYYMKISWLKN